MEREINRFYSVEDEFPGLEGFELDPSSSSSMNQDNLLNSSKKDSFHVSYKKTSRLLSFKMKKSSENQDSSDDEYLREKKQDNQDKDTMHEMDEYKNLKSNDVEERQKKELAINRNGNSFSTANTSHISVSVQSIPHSSKISEVRDEGNVGNVGQQNQSEQINQRRSMNREFNIKKKYSIGMLSDLNWSKAVGNNNILRSQQILYKLIQKHNEHNFTNNKKFGR